MFQKLHDFLPCSSHVIQEKSKFVPMEGKKPGPADYDWGHVLGEGAYGDVCTTEAFSLQGRSSH
jgi:hypothetical protein